MYTFSKLMYYNIIAYMMSRFQNDSYNHNSTYNHPFQNGCYKTRVLEPFIELYELNIIMSSTVSKKGTSHYI